MADLTAAFIAAGCADVRTYIQSGNVVFSHPSKAPADHLTACLTEAFGFEIPVVVRTARQLAGLVEHNPYPDLEPNKLGVAFLPPHGAVPTIAADACAPESFV